MTERHARRRVLKTIGTGGLLGMTGVAGCVRNTGSNTPTASPESTTADSDGNTPTHTTGSSSIGVASNAEFRVSGFDVSTTKTAPQKSYFLRITKSYSESAVQDEAGVQTIRDVSDVADPAVQATLKDILSEGKIWRSEIPDGLQEVVQEVDFFTWESHSDPGDTYTHWGIKIYSAYPNRDPVVEFSAELVDDRVAPDDPGAIEFVLTNTADTTQVVFSGTVPPFSVLMADAPGAKDRALLWRDYEEEGCVSFQETDGNPGMLVCAIGVNTPIDPGETVKKRYRLRPTFDRDSLAGWGFDTPGEYSINETLTYHREGDAQGPSTHVDWQVRFNLEEA